MESTNYRNELSDCEQAMSDKMFKRLPKKDSGIHPECGPDEIFIGNYHQESFKEIKWETKRTGNIAYDDRGNPLDDARYFPVFVKRIEYQQVD